MNIVQLIEHYKDIFNIILEINRKPKENHIKIRGKEVAVTCLIKL